MSLTPWVPTVRRIRDGELVDQATVNVPIDQMTQREQHLYEKFEELSGKSVLISFGQPIHPTEPAWGTGELNIVYFKSDSHGDGLSRSVTGFSSNSTSSMFQPKNSNYAFGLVKTNYPQSKTADLYTEGLCELSVDINHPTLGLIPPKANGDPTDFVVGPYFLSAKVPGKITQDPSGIPVYVGYAISPRRFLLHTNVDEFSQFFINYRYHVLDRVAGKPVRTPTTTETFTGSISVATAASPVSILTITAAVPSLSVGSILSGTNVAATTAVVSLITGTFGAAGSTYTLSLPNTTTVTSQLITAVSPTGIWSITDTNTDILGWVPVSVLPASISRPAGAVFYYNIPKAPTIDADTGLDSADFEKEEALELSGFLPPVPANFVQLYVDGALVRYKDSKDLGGWYSINEYGLWWHTDKDGEQPWAADYPSNQQPSSWYSIIKPGITRRRVFISFSKFNPALRTQLVSSLRAYDKTGKNKSSNFIKFLNADNLSEESHTGDLIVSIDPQIRLSGVSVDDAGFTYPAGLDVGYTANRAVAGIKYSKEEGEFKAALTPVVAKINGVNGIVAKESAAGVWDVGYGVGSISGQVDSIEPINARLEFIELSSYIKLPPPTTTKFGLIGKIVLPSNYPNNRPLNLAFHLFGDADVDTGDAANNRAAFLFVYSSVSASNVSRAANYTTINTQTYPNTTNTVEFSLAADAAYTARTALKIANANFSIPADFVREDSIINFKILRVSPTARSYAGNIGLLGVYWEIPTTA